MTIPVSGPDITSVICGNSTTINDDSQDHEPNTGGDFHRTENKFNLKYLAVDADCQRVITHFPVAFDSKVLDDCEGE